MDSDMEWIEWKAQKQRLVGQSAYLDRFMHLWNLLTRSNFYASSLLTIIEEKQKKRCKTPTKKKQKKNKQQNPQLHDQTETVVMSVVLNLVSKVVELNAQDCDGTNKSTMVESVNFQAESNQGLMNNLLEPATNVKVEHFSSGSDLVSTAMSAGKEKFFDDSNEFEEAKYLTEKADQVLTEEDYRRNLSKRRGIFTDLDEFKPVLDIFNNEMELEPVTEVTTETSPCEELVNTESSSGPVSQSATEERDESVDENYKSTVEDANTLHVGSQMSIKSEKLDSNSSFPVSMPSEGIYHNYESKDHGSQNCSSEKVCCPICEHKYSLKSINKHLDVCTGRDEARESLRSRNTNQQLACLGKRSGKNKTTHPGPETPPLKSRKTNMSDSTKSLIKQEDKQNTAFPQVRNTATKKTTRKNQMNNNGKVEEGEIDFLDVARIGNNKKTKRANKIAPTLFGPRRILTRRSCVPVSSTEVREGQLPVTQVSPSITTDEQVQENITRSHSEKRKGQSGLENIKSALEKTILATKTVNEKLFAEAKEAVAQIEAKKREKEKLKLKTRTKQVMSPPRKTRKTNKLNSPKGRPHTSPAKHETNPTEKAMEKSKENSMESSNGNHADGAMGKPASTFIEKPTDNHMQNSLKTSLEKTTVDPTEKPTDNLKEKPKEEKAVKPAIETKHVQVNDFKPPKPKQKSPRHIPLIVRTMDNCNVETSSSDEVEIEIPTEPTRRSSRVKSRVSYQEVKSSEEESDEMQEKRVKKVKPSQRMKEKIMRKSDDEYQVPVESVSKTSKEISVKKTKSTGEEVNEEEGELGSEINVEELLEKRFHQPDVRSYNNLVMHIDGNKYIQGELVDPSQPKLLIGGILREYQIVGYQWLKILYENGESGILADEMGLGKTIQCIALICKLIQMKVNGPFLVCAPTTTINNWLSEFKKFAPQVSVLLYYGTALERVHLVECLIEQTKIHTQLVVITSYEILMRDLPVMRTYQWSYLVLDEGHRVKNLNSKTLKDIKVISTKGKVMLTGTPLQNNLTELWSLLNFLFPEVFDDVKSFQSWFDMDLLKKDDKILSMLHQVLTPFLLRRVKADVDIKIPPKREMLVLAPLVPLQDQYYRAVVDKSIIQLIKNQEYYDVTPGVADPDLIATNSQEEEKPTRNTRSCLKQKYGLNADDFAVNVTLSNMMMLLRKCCNHPYLVHHPCDANTLDLKIDEDLVTSCGKMMLLDKMLPQLKKRGHKVLLFSQMTTMLDIIEDYCNLREFTFVRFDGKTKCQDRVEYIDAFNSDPSIFIFLLSTRAGGIGINLTGADTVIIYDSDWNPQNDIQAQDRCHRIGQEKPVVVYRLVTASTIDQQIMERAARKRILEKMIIHENKFKGELNEELHNLKSISPTQLLHLLESNHTQCKSDGKVIDDFELHQLLDRSDMTGYKMGGSPCVKPLKETSNEGKVDVRQLASGCSGSVISKPRAFQVIEETKREKVFVF